MARSKKRPPAPPRERSQGRADRERRIAETTPEHQNGKYLPMYVRLAYQMALLGYTDEEMAPVFEISITQFRKWKREKEDFTGALKRGRASADGQVVKRLFQRAMGWSHKSVKFFYDQKRGKVVSKPYVEKFAPDVVACIFWLKNRQSGYWRDRAWEAFKKDDPQEQAKALRQAFKAMEDADGVA